MPLNKTNVSFKNEKTIVHFNFQGDPCCISVYITTFMYIKTNVLQNQKGIVIPNYACCVIVGGRGTLDYCKLLNPHVNILTSCKINYTT